MNEFEFITKLIKEKSGICIDESKSYLVDTRLKPIARKHGLEDVSHLINKIMQTNDAKLIAQIVDSMTTNESLFFRDQKPFEQLKRIILPEYQDRSMKIWSAAASTGQEIYSAIITLQEALFKNYNILGTDISPPVIERSKLGKYSQFEIQRGMPITMLLKYFTQEGENWTIKPEYKINTKFQTYNLLDSYSQLGNFDVIFCRNVLIYFDAATKTEVYEKMHQVLNKDGYLFLGSSESCLNYTDKFEPVKDEVGLFKPVH